MELTIRSEYQHTMTNQNALLRVRLTPKGGRDALMKRDEGILHVRVAAPPVDGAANKALIILFPTHCRSFRGSNLNTLL